MSKTLLEIAKEKLDPEMEARWRAFIEECSKPLPPASPEEMLAGFRAFAEDVWAKQPPERRWFVLWPKEEP